MYHSVDLFLLVDDFVLLIDLTVRLKQQVSVHLVTACYKYKFSRPARLLVFWVSVFNFVKHVYLSLNVCSAGKQSFVRCTKCSRFI